MFYLTKNYAYYSIQRPIANMCLRVTRICSRKKNEPKRTKKKEQKQKIMRKTSQLPQKYRVHDALYSILSRHLILNTLKCIRHVSLSLCLSIWSTHPIVLNIRKNQFIT